MNTYCKFYLEENFFNDNKLNTYYFYGKSNQRIVHRDNSLIKSELQKCLIRDMYFIYREKGFNRKKDCYNFKGLFDTSFNGKFFELGHKQFFDDNLNKFESEV